MTKEHFFNGYSSQFLVWKIVKFFGKIIYKEKHFFADFIFNLYVMSQLVSHLDES